MKKGEFQLITKNMGKVLSFGFSPIDKIMDELKVLVLFVGLLILFPIQLICWLFNKKEFRYTNPYHLLIN